MTVWQMRDGFKNDLMSKRMSVCWRRESSLTGEFSHDAKQVLVYAWRTSAAWNWARQFGHRYCEGG